MDPRATSTSEALCTTSASIYTNDTWRASSPSTAPRRRSDMASHGTASQRQFVWVPQ
jgi:hypothetical protein